LEKGGNRKSLEGSSFTKRILGVSEGAKLEKKKKRYLFRKK